MSAGSRAEYLLFLWQTEDILRAYECDFEKLKANYLCDFHPSTEDEGRENEEWYAALCEMMHTEGVVKQGHLSVSRIVMEELKDLHEQLLASKRFPYYREMYYKVLPYIVELRTHGADHSKSELELCFDALYGVLMLRLQKKPITEETKKAIGDITTMLGQLADYYAKNRIKPLDL